MITKQNETQPWRSLVCGGEAGRKKTEGLCSRQMKNNNYFPSSSALRGKDSNVLSKMLKRSICKLSTESLRKASFTTTEWSLQDSLHVWIFSIVSHNFIVVVAVVLLSNHVCRLLFQVDPPHFSAWSYYSTSIWKEIGWVYMELESSNDFLVKIKWTSQDSLFCKTPWRWTISTWNYCYYSKPKLASYHNSVQKLIGVWVWYTFNMRNSIPLHPINTTWPQWIKYYRDCWYMQEKIPSSVSTLLTQLEWLIPLAIWSDSVSKGPSV